MKLRRFKKKIRQDIISSVSVLNPKKDETIVVGYPMWRYTQVEVYRIYKAIAKSFTKNKVVFIPDDFSLQHYSIEEVDRMIKCLIDMKGR